jgi:hypothetical protein
MEAKLYTMRVLLLDHEFHCCSRDVISRVCFIGPVYQSIHTKGATERLCLQLSTPLGRLSELVAIPLEIALNERRIFRGILF